jgi:hypothetical protein
VHTVGKSSFLLVASSAAAHISSPIVMLRLIPAALCLDSTLPLSMTFVVSSVLAFALARVMFGAFCMVVSSDVLSVLLSVVNVPVIMIMTISATKVLPFLT